MNILLDPKDANENKERLNYEGMNGWELISTYPKGQGANSGKYEPIVVMKKNGKKPLVVIDAEYFVRLHNEGNNI